MTNRMKMRSIIVENVEDNTKKTASYELVLMEAAKGGTMSSVLGWMKRVYKKTFVVTPALTKHFVHVFTPFIYFIYNAFSVISFIFSCTTYLERYTPAPFLPPRKLPRVPHYPHVFRNTRRK